MSVTTSQGICLPDLRVGDRWLFYLEKDEHADRFLVAYGSPSGPIGQEQENVDRLRRLAKLQGEGLIIGEVDNPNGKPRANHRVIVRRLPDGAEFVSLTNKDGKFEFPPLRAGKYDLNPNTKPGLWTMWYGETTVESNQCMNYLLDLDIDGTISGYVRTDDGKPLKFADVQAVFDGGSSSAFTDESGHFEIHGLAPGRYLVGLHIADEDRGKASVYAPGVRDQSKATVIELGRAERREGIDIRIPSATSK
jgi:hypothetical protein